MIREEIIEGLKVALFKGEPLKKAMMTFYNAGYKKQDIEDSTRALQVPQYPQFYQQMPQTTQKTEPKISKPVQRVSKYGNEQEEASIPAQQYSQVQQAKPAETKEPAEKSQEVMEQPVMRAPRRIQGVSDYDKKPSKWTSVVIFILVFILLSLIGALVAVFLFKDELTQMLNNLF